MFESGSTAHRLSAPIPSRRQRYPCLSRACGWAILNAVFRTQRGEPLARQVSRVGESGGSSTSTSISTRLLLLSVATTLLAVIGGQWLVWSVYATSITSFDVDATTVAPPPEDRLVVGIGRTPGSPAEWIAYATAFARVGRDLEVPVALHYAGSQDAILDAVLGGEVDIALVPTHAYLELSESGAVVLVAAPVVSSAGDDTAVMVVDAASPYRSLEDLEGARLLVAPGSLAGNAFARWLLDERDLPQDDFFEVVTEAGSQDEDLRKVSAGEADATAVRRTALDSWPPGTFRIIAESPTFGLPPVVAQRSLDPSVVNAVRDSLLTIGESGVLPDRSSLSGFRRVEDAEYEFSRRLHESFDISATGTSEDLAP